MTKDWFATVAIPCNCGCGNTLYLSAQPEEDPCGPDPGYLSVSNPNGGGALSLTDSELRKLHDLLSGYIAAKDGEAT